MSEDTKQILIIVTFIVFIFLVISVFSAISDYRDGEIIKFCIENGVDLTSEMCNIR